MQQKKVTKKGRMRCPQTPQSAVGAGWVETHPARLMWIPWTSAVSDGLDPGVRFAAAGGRGSVGFSAGGGAGMGATPPTRPRFFAVGWGRPLGSFSAGAGRLHGGRVVHTAPHADPPQLRRAARQAGGPYSLCLGVSRIPLPHRPPGVDVRSVGSGLSRTHGDGTRVVERG